MKIFPDIPSHVDLSDLVVGYWHPRDGRGYATYVLRDGEVRWHTGMYHEGNPVLWGDEIRDIDGVTIDNDCYMMAGRR